MFCTQCGTKLNPQELVCPNCGFDMQEDELKAGIMQALKVEDNTQADAPEAAEAIAMALQEEPEAQDVDGEDAEALAQALLLAEKAEELDLENILMDGEDMQTGIEDLTEEEIYRTWTEVPDEIPMEMPNGKKKRWIVLGILVGALVILGLGVFFGVRYYQDEISYEKAVSYLEDGRYDEAFSLFMNLDGFKDSEVYASDLQQKFQAYNSAVIGMKTGKFDGVEEVFRELGDFKDSAQMLKYGITWAKGEYLLHCAQKQNRAGMELVAGVDENTEEYLVWVLMFMSAKEQYAQITEYQDAVQKIQLCYLGAARILAQNGQMDTAVVYKDMMDADTQLIFEEELKDICADEEFLRILKLSLERRMVLDSEEDSDLRRGVQTEQSYLGKFQKSYFWDENLKEICLSYLEGVYLQWMSLDSNGECVDATSWVKGEYLRLQAVKDLYQQYGFLADNTELANYFLDGLEDARAQYQIYSGIRSQLSGYLEGSGEMLLNVKYINDSGYAFNVTFFFTFYKEGEQVAQTTATMAVGKDQKKELKGKLPEEEYDSWKLNWTVFDITGNGQADVSGVYTIYSMLMLEYESLFDLDDLMEAGRGDDAIELLADGIGNYNSGGVQRTIGYDDKSFWFADSPEVKIPFRIAGGMMSFTLDETEYTYRK